VRSEDGSSPRVIVGISLSLAGLEALRYAVVEASRREVPLIAVRAWDYQSSWAWSVEPCEVPFRDHAPDLIDLPGQIIAEAFQDAAVAIPSGLIVVRHTGGGRPAVLLQENVTSPRDLLVVGAGRRWPGGQVTRACVRHAACPVVVVPPPAMAKEAGGRRTVRRLFREATAALEESRGDVPR